MIIKKIFSKFEDNSKTNCTFLEFQEFFRTKVIFQDFSRSVRTLRYWYTAYYTYNPAEQGVHSVCPAKEYIPDGQAYTDNFESVSGQAYPALQIVQIVCLAMAYVPGRQVSISDPSVLGQILPAGHGVQIVAFPRE